MRFLQSIFIALGALAIAAPVNWQLTGNCFNIKKQPQCNTAISLCQPCEFCTSKAVPSSCFDAPDAQSLPPAAFVCTPNPNLNQVPDDCAGQLSYILRQDDNSCALYTSTLSGTPSLKKAALQSCHDDVAQPSNFDAPATFYNTYTRTMFYTSGKGKYVWVYDPFVGLEDQYATLPQQYSSVLGFATNSSNLFIITSTQILSLPLLKADDGYDPSQVASVIYTFPSAYDAANGDLAFNWGEKAALYSPSTSSIFSYDFATQSVQTVSISKTISGSSSQTPTFVALDYYPAADEFIGIGSYEVFYVNTQGTVKSVVAFPDGPGFPRVNTLFKNYWYVADLDEYFVVNLLTNTISDAISFDNAPLMNGDFQYIY